MFVSYLLFYRTYLEVFTLGIFWTVYESYWSSYITRNMGIYPACFEIVTYYLRLRYEHVETNLRTILRHPKKMVLMARPMHRVSRLLRELDSINADLRLYNHYWRKYVMAIFVSYLPQILFEVYVCIYFTTETSVFVFSVVLTINMVALISQVLVFSAQAIDKVGGHHHEEDDDDHTYHAYLYLKLFDQAHSLRTPLHQLYHRMSRVRPLHPKQSANVRFVLKLATFLEQYSGRHHLGFFLLDFCIMDWHFFGQTIINCALYFLLIVSLLR